MAGPLAPVVRGEQGDDLAFEPVSRGDQEAQIDQHEQGVGEHVLGAGRHGDQIGAGIELIDHLIQLHRPVHAEGVGQPVDGLFQPGG